MACRGRRRFYISEVQFNAVPIWWSTGVYDPLFPPSLLKSYTETFSAVRSPPVQCFCIHFGSQKGLAGLRSPVSARS